MKTIHTDLIKTAVKELCIEANYVLPVDIQENMKYSCKVENKKNAKEVLQKLCENCNCARDLNIPICQDTGMAVVFIEIGQDVSIVGDDLYTAINQGVREGYLEGFLRCSVVRDPLKRINTQDNTPAIIHAVIKSGDQLKITVCPKGFGSENMSAIKMFNPTAEKEDIIEFVCEVVKAAGSNACPPIVVGVGLGGTFEYAALLSKIALCRSVNERNSDKFYEELELEMLKNVNALGIGAQGFGGDITALAVNIETFATHIAGLPCAVNIGCHVTRHQSRVL